MHTLGINETLHLHNTDVENGLTHSQVSDYQEKYGMNQLDKRKKKSVFIRFFLNFKEFMIIVLLIASAVSYAIGEKTDAFIILSIIILNALISTYQEIKAEGSIASLQSLTAPKCMVMRDGEKLEIDTKYIVPGDIVIIEAGNSIPADGRLIEAQSLKIEESTLTGESLPVDKNTDVILKSDIPLGDKFNCVFSGTTVSYGIGKFVVTAIGMHTELGKIASLMTEEKNEATPLQVKLAEIGKILGMVVLLISAIIFGLGIIQGRDIFEMFFTAVSLSVAAIPEGLPAIVTIVLSLGVQRLSQENAVVKKLPAVETLGSSSVICSDKTGTLTQNKMIVQDVFTFDTSAMDELLLGSVLCNDATDKIGDPTEIALIQFGISKGYDKKTVNSAQLRMASLPFDSERKMMSTIHHLENVFISYTKGALDEIIKRCDFMIADGMQQSLTDEYKKVLFEQNALFASKALRVLAISKKYHSKMPSDLSFTVIEEGMIFIGLIAMMDPPREEVYEAIKKCKLAGIRPIMITGDHQLTATAIAEKLGILNTGEKVITGSELNLMSDDVFYKNIESFSVYARVAPEHKVRIVKAWQSKNQVVAMTGDGVNDAPALRMAEIGVAMGKVGTDVSRNAASIVLMDDNFSTIVTAIEEGRAIYSNIKKAIHYLLSCNMGEIILLLLAILFNLPIPLLPVQILWVNLITDSFPALALGVEAKDSDLLDHPPRSKSESIFSDGLIYKIGIEGLIIGFISFVVFIYGLQFDLTVARTMTFLTISFSQLIHSINVRSDKSIIFVKGLFTNKYSLLAIAISSLLQFFILVFPFTQKIFKVTMLNPSQFAIVFIFSFIPLLIIEIYKLIKYLAFEKK
ncbi:MAG: cation-translocating P-type ATPase [Clostridiales bacterium]|nr:cation-translocating P-type ATPase [Clostridiales bacterium]